MRQRKIPAVFMRGGTSKAVMFHRHHLPEDESLWPQIFVVVLGAGDATGRQLDGLGGGISSLSKVCVIGPPSRSDADVDYTFVQLSPKSEHVDFSSSCGNMAAADGETPIGSLMVVDVQDQEEAIQFNQGDPFYQSGVWDRDTIAIHPFIKRRGWTEGY